MTSSAAASGQARSRARPWPWPPQPPRLHRWGTVAQERQPYLRLELVSPAAGLRRRRGDGRAPGCHRRDRHPAPAAPLVAQLAIGRLRALTADGEWLTFAVAEGFAKVQFNKVIVLADAAEEAAQIDVARVQGRGAGHRALGDVPAGTVPEGEDVDPTGSNWR